MSANNYIYQPKNKLRIVTAAALFDGHDAAINIMRRIMQASGAEVIHLGHNRSANEIVNCAIQEDAQAIAITSYQGGHIEFFKYIYDLLNQNNCSHIKIFGGGGGTILPSEIEILHKYGIAHIYSPDEGRQLGLQGMINDLLMQSDFSTSLQPINLKSLNKINALNHQLIAQLISFVENNAAEAHYLMHKINNIVNSLAVKPPVLGITGTGGSGKSSIVDEIVRRFLLDFKNKTIAIISVDPSKRKTGGALLGDRIRMNSINHPNVYMRSLATRQSNLALSKYVEQTISICKAAQFDLIIVETSGIGQSDTEIIDHSNISLYVMTPEYGAASQLEKIDMLDYADFVVLNKFDKRGALDALRDIKKQYKRNHNLWDTPDSEIPVFGAIASQYNDEGTNTLYTELIKGIAKKTGANLSSSLAKNEQILSEKNYIIPPQRTRYLSEISEAIQNYNKWVIDQADVANKIYALKTVIAHANTIKNETSNNPLIPTLTELQNQLHKKINPENLEKLENWTQKKQSYKNNQYTYPVRGKQITVDTTTKSLSGLQIPKIALPNYTNWGDILYWILQENVPGEFPYTAGVFPFKRQNEDPTRMFAGEGGPERTNRRFHYVSLNMPAKRLSTAFDSVTLYGEDPDYRPDIYGKIGNAGVSICTLNDTKKLYSGFDLCNPATSVSMTINGPAAIILAFYINTAIDQQCEIYIKNNNLEALINEKIAQLFNQSELEKPKYLGENENLPIGNNGLGLQLLGCSGCQILPKNIYNEIKKSTLQQIRGTVQADILKEDQAQNTCIFSTEFSLKLMGDVQQYFINNKVRNFYSVSISGYHIAEAGANPISQLAFTLANGFTYIEYYLSRGMNVDDFAPSLSFFFSNGIDPEYAVIGRVARKIWAKALKYKYNANERSQMLKYHIQTSGRSLHAQEISFNDIRTTLQALYAIYDNCNSLHTNAYDEAITTPTEESVRRAMAIQLIINKELGLAKNENPLQGAFIINELTDLVEEAVLYEFNAISERGGVLGAMETMYQRGKIQEESLYYETLKHNGSYPIIGVNTFLSDNGSPTVLPKEVIRSTEQEKINQINVLNQFKLLNKLSADKALNQLKTVCLNNQNIFEELLETVKYCSLGQITQTLYEVGGQYRRGM